MSMVIIQSMMSCSLRVVFFLRRVISLNDKSMKSQIIAGIIIAKIDGNIFHQKKYIHQIIVHHESIINNDPYRNRLNILYEMVDGLL
jgi:hypothetical protein